MLLFILIMLFIGIPAGLVWWLLARDRGEPEPIGVLWLAFGVGLIGGIAAALLENILPARGFQIGASLPVVLGTMMGVSVIEEGLKFVPLSLFIYRKPYFNEHTDGIMYFALVGLGFGLPENVLYTLSLGTRAGLVRVVLLPFFHAATTGLVGYALVRRKLGRRSPFEVVVPLMAIVLTHGLYDFCIRSQRGLLEVIGIGITVGLTLAFFGVYMRASRLDKQARVADTAHDNFCRSCGFPNPNHDLYCTHCGEHA